MSVQPAQGALSFDLTGSCLCAYVNSLKLLPLALLIIHFSNNNKQEVALPKPARESQKAEVIFKKKLYLWPFNKNTLPDWWIDKNHYNHLYNDEAGVQKKKNVWTDLHWHSPLMWAAHCSTVWDWGTFTTQAENTSTLFLAFSWYFDFFFLLFIHFF